MRRRKVDRRKDQHAKKARALRRKEEGLTKAAIEWHNEKARLSTCGVKHALFTVKQEGYNV